LLIGLASEPETTKTLHRIKFLSDLFIRCIYTMPAKAIPLKNAQHLPEPALCATLINIYPQGFAGINACYTHYYS
jgi:hypothetical protein